MKVLQTVDVIHMYNVWDKVKDFFTDSDRSELDEHTIEYFKLNVLNRSYNLLVVVEDNIIIGAFLMYFMNTPTHRVLNIAAAGGKDIVVKEVADQIEQFARSQGATKIKAQAKDAQARLYKMVMGLEKTTNVVEKLLQEYAMKLMSIFNFFFNPLTWVKLTTFNLGDDTPAPQQVTTQTSNIPDYMQPYVESMLGATQNQLFNTTTDAQGNTTLNGLKPYTPYSTNMNDYVAGFSPLQQQSQSAAGNLQTPGQFGQANQMATASGLGSLGTATNAAGAGNQYMQMAQDPNAIKNFMNPYLQQTLDPALAELSRQYGITGTQEQSQATGAGAFGGSREALMAAENQRNLGTAQSQMIGQGYNNAFQAAQQAQQFGSNLGLQGQQAALQGYGQAGQAASTLGSLGTQDLAAQQGIIGTQNQIGAQQTAAEQAKINQSVQDYANAQQYPLMELGVMSNMTRGLPLSAPTTSMYQAQPTAATQLIGSAGAIGSLGAAAPKAAGGILSVKNFDVGGAVEYDLSQMPTDKLNELKDSAQSKIEIEKINKILAERKIEPTPNFAPGGIVAFGVGGGADVDYGDMYSADLDKAMAEKQANSTNPIAKLISQRNAAEKDAVAGKDSYNNYQKANDLTSAIVDSNSPGGGGFVAPVDKAGNRIPPINPNPAPAPDAKPAAPAGPPQVSLDQLLAKYMGPAPGGKGLPATTTGTESPSNSMDAQLQSVISERKNIDQQLADGLNNIYQDPVNAPYAKKRFDQFQSEIDNASEKDRQMFWLHSATMFATMATQPGGVVKAAMGALAQEIPLYVKDKEAQEKHLDDIKKAQYDITQSEIARRVGDLKTSLDLKDKGLDKAADIYIAINKDKSEKAKLAEEVRSHDLQNRTNTINAVSNLYQAQKEPADLTTLKAIAAHPELKAVKEDLTLGPAEERTKAALEKTYSTSMDSDMQFEDWLDKHGLTYAGRPAKASNKHANWGEKVTIK